MLPSDDIKSKINIVDLVGEYVPLKKAGANFRGLCPFHQEKTPSFMVSQVKQIWHCFGCGLGGDIFEFVKQIEAVEFPEALQILATRAGVVLKRPTVEYQQEVDQKKVLYQINELAAKYYAKVLAESSVATAARAYLQKRGLKPETIIKWEIGFAPSDFHSFENFIVKKGFQRQEALLAGLLSEKDGSASPSQGGPASTGASQGGQFFDRFRERVMFPLFDVHGRVMGFTARLLEGPATSGGVPTQAKYVNSPETAIYSKSHLIYGLHLAKTEIRKQDEVIVVEGNVDVITCHEAGFTNVVGSSGTALTLGQLELLKRFTNNLNFAFDVDEAGLLATRRAVELALSLGFNCRIISIPKILAKDPDELIRRDPSLWGQQVKGAKNFLDFYFDSVFASMDVESSIDKKRAVADLLPLLSLLPDPIDRSHYVNKLALKLGVEQKIILDLLNKNFISRTPAPVGLVRRQFTPKKTKQELLERRVLGLFLKNAKNLRAEWGELTGEDFTTPVLQEIFEKVAPLVSSGEFELAEFVTAEPKIGPEIELLVFALENELSISVDWKIEDLKKQFLGELKLSTTKQKMQQLWARIQQAEVSGRMEEAKTLSTEFNNLSRELAKYHAV